MSDLKYACGNEPRRFDVVLGFISGNRYQIIEIGKEQDDHVVGLRIPSGQRDERLDLGSLKLLNRHTFLVLTPSFPLLAYASGEVPMVGDVICRIGAGNNEYVVVELNERGWIRLRLPNGDLSEVYYGLFNCKLKQRMDAAIEAKGRPVPLDIKEKPRRVTFRRAEGWWGK